MSLTPNLEDLSPKAKEALSPDATPRFRQAAVAGDIDEIPLRDRLALLVELSRTEDCGPNISEYCSTQFELLPVTTIADALTTPQDPAVIHALALSQHAVGGLAEVLLLSVPNIAAETLELIALTADQVVCERIASDQALIRKCPQLAARLYMNQSARMSTVSRLQDWAEAEGIELDMKGEHGPAEADVARRKAARARAAQAAQPYQPTPPAEPEPPPLHPEPNPSPPRINLIGSFASSASLFSDGRNLLTWIKKNLDDWRTVTPTVPQHLSDLEELGADPHMADYVRTLIKKIAELRQIVDRKNATIAALVERQTL